MATYDVIPNDQEQITCINLLAHSLTQVPSYPHSQKPVAVLAVSDSDKVVQGWGHVKIELTESGDVDIDKSIPYSATANVLDQIHAIGSDEQWTFYNTLEPGEIECSKINDSGFVKQINIVDMKPDRSKDATLWTDIPLNYYCDLTTLGNDTLAGVYKEYRTKVAEHFPDHPILSKID